eukprot:scaffold18381_cov79-Phaeocystis_antarctica.AAC.3
MSVHRCSRSLTAHRLLLPHTPPFALALGVSMEGVRRIGDHASWHRQAPCRREVLKRWKPAAGLSEIRGAAVRRGGSKKWGRQIFFGQPIDPCRGLAARRAGSAALTGDHLWAGFERAPHVDELCACRRHGTLRGCVPALREVNDDAPTHAPRTSTRTQTRAPHARALAHAYALPSRAHVASFYAAAVARHLALQWGGYPLILRHTYARLPPLDARARRWQCCGAPRRCPLQAATLTLSLRFALALAPVEPRMRVTRLLVPWRRSTAWRQ